MPFKSEKQRRWMHANEPEMAKKWEKKYKKEDRDYKDEYKKFQSSKKAKKYRAELNKYNRKKGTYGNGDGKDASHNGGKIVGFEAQSKNRGRAEKSRLKKESKEQRSVSNAHIAKFDKDIKKVIVDIGRNGDRQKAMELMKIYKKHWTEFVINFQKSMGVYESINEAKEPSVIANLRDIVKKKQNKVIKDPKSGKRMRVDGYSANAIIKVYDALNTSNKKKFSDSGLMKMQSIAFKFVR